MHCDLLQLGCTHLIIQVLKANPLSIFHWPSCTADSDVDIQALNIAEFIDSESTQPDAVNW